MVTADYNILQGDVTDASLQSKYHIMYVATRDDTILQYIDISQHFLQQYNIIRLKGNINILHIVIYYSVCCITPQK